MGSSSPILFFDSGVGGLSVVAPTRIALPTGAFVYAADNAGFPYGIKSEAEIAARVPALLGRLAERYRPRLVVIACNTASTIALASVRSALDLPVVGTVPAIKPAAALSKTRVIGVLGTDATIRQTYVDQLSAQFAHDCVVIRRGAAELVVLAERKLRGKPIDIADVERALEPLFTAPDGDRIDVVVLACTHFPLLIDELNAAAPHPVRFVDGSSGIARRIAALTDGQTWPDAAPPGVAVFTRFDDSVAALSPALGALGFSTLTGL